MASDNTLWFTNGLFINDFRISDSITFMNSFLFNLVNGRAEKIDSLESMLMISIIKYMSIN